MSDTDFFCCLQINYTKKKTLRELRIFQLDMLEVFTEIWQIVLTPTIIFLQTLLMILISPKKMFKNIFWRHLILLNVTRDSINDASFRQKLDLISKNILRRQNPLELVFEDISTFDAENPIVGSLLREIDIKKKQSDSDFIKSLPSKPGKEFEIKKN